ADEVVADHQRLVRRRPADGCAPECVVIPIAHAVAPAPGTVEADIKHPAESVILLDDQRRLLFRFQRILLRLTIREIRQRRRAWLGLTDGGPVMSAQAAPDGSALGRV